MPEPSNRGIHFPEQQQQTKAKHEAANVVETVKDKAHELASSVGNSAQEAWDSTRHQAQEAWDSTRQQAQQYASQIGHSAEEALDSTNQFIRRYPVACVVGGFLIGALFAGAFGGVAAVTSNSSRYR